VFRDRGLPDEVPSFELKAPGGRLWIVNILKETELASSGSEARRLVRQGAVEVDGTRVTDEEAEVSLDQTREVLIRVGKRRFARVKAASGGT
jgi:tyrosyl-tRNA synthetase